MSTPGEQCSHGGLKRKCEICERDDEIAELRRELSIKNSIADADKKEIAELRDECEHERMRLAACGAAALANTPKTVADRLTIDSPYWSASYADVCRAVDREMEFRAALSASRREARELALDRETPLDTSGARQTQALKAGNLARQILERDPAAHITKECAERWGETARDTALEEAAGICETLETWTEPMHDTKRAAAMAIRAAKSSPAPACSCGQDRPESRVPGCPKRAKP